MRVTKALAALIFLLSGQLCVAQEQASIESLYDDFKNAWRVSSGAPDGISRHSNEVVRLSEDQIKSDNDNCKILMRNQVNHGSGHTRTYYDQFLIVMDLRRENVLRQLTRTSESSVEILFSPIGEVVPASADGTSLETGAFMRCNRRYIKGHSGPDIETCINPIFYSKDEAKKAAMVRAFETLARRCAPVSEEDEQKFAQDKERFAKAKIENDCAVVSELQEVMSAPGAGADCAFQAGLQAETARSMYFAAVKLDTAKDHSRAKQLYLEILNRFPEDDLAIQAAGRLTQLNDMEIMATAQAENAKALEAARKELAASAAAERMSAQAAADANAEIERLRKQAEADRKATDARLRQAEQAAADARQQANSQPSRNTACDHVSHGMYFDYNGGGILGVANGRWEVIGINREGGIVTARKTGQDFRRQISCYSVK